MPVGITTTRFGGNERFFTMQVDVEPVNKMLIRIREALDDRSILQVALPAAQKIMFEAELNSPYRTGALRGSSKIELGPRYLGLSLVLGFNTPYAALQDIGHQTLPSKGPGSTKGPNQYFSEVLRNRVMSFYREVIKGLEKKIYSSRDVPRPKGARKSPSFFKLRLPAPRQRVHYRGSTGGGASRVAGTQRGASSQYRSRVTSRAGTRDRRRR